MLNLLRVMSKIANVNGYDETGRIRDKSGNFINKTDIAVLLLNAMLPGKLIVGANHFVSLMREAQVNPDWILNENIRYKLMSSSDQLVKVEEVKESQVIVTKSTSPEPNIELSATPVKGTKRKVEFHEEIGEPTKAKRRIFYPNRENWVVPDE